MFGKMVKTNGFSGQKGLKYVLGAVAGVALMTSAHAQAQNIELYTTHDDWSAWSNNGDSSNSESAGGQALPDSDGSVINGLGNTNGTGPGNVSGTGGGSMAVSENINTFDYVYGGGNQVGGNPAFATALVNGLTSNGGTGLLRFDFTMPTPQASGSYFTLGVVFNYGDYGNSGIYQQEYQFDQYASPTNIINDGNGWYTEYLPYNLSNPALLLNDTSGSTYFQMGLIINSNYDLVSPAVGKAPAVYAPISFAVDNMSIEVPEPCTMGLVGAGLSLLTLRRRRRTA